MPLPAVQDHVAQLRGLRFHYREWPNPGAQALVALHGFTGHARTWDSFAVAMQHKYRVLAFDQRGHGESDWADDYSVDASVADVHAFVNALGLKQFVLLGLSMGGRNAFTYASVHPQEVERLVIVDIGPVTNPAGSARIQTGAQSNDIFDTPDDAFAQMRKGNPRAPDAELRHRAVNNLMLREDGKWTWRYDARLRAPGRVQVRPSPEESWATVRKITAPTLLLRGAESDVLAPETAEQMAREIPNCRLAVVQGSGHSIPTDNPQGFLEAVQTFL